MWGISHIRLNDGEKREKQPKNRQNRDFQRVVVRKSQSWHAKISITFASAKYARSRKVKLSKLTLDHLRIAPRWQAAVFAVKTLVPSQLFGPVEPFRCNAILISSLKARTI